MKITGLFHLHSNYSYDGELSLEEIISFAKRYGCQFVVLNEHSKEFSPEKYKELLTKCQELSDNNFCLVPGMEFACGDNNLHILALGLNKIIFDFEGNFEEIEKILNFIKSSNGIAILAHPYRGEALKLKENFLGKFTGIEIWNVREDGKGIPKYRNISYLKNLRKKGYSLWGFGGLDFHDLKDFGFVKTVVEINELTQDCLLKAFKEGNFYIKKGIFVIDSQGNIKCLRKYFYIICRFLYASFKNFAKLIEKLLKILKIKPPAFIYKIARKLF